VLLALEGSLGVAGQNVKDSAQQKNLSSNRKTRLVLSFCKPDHFIKMRSRFDRGLEL
jgi:hypothetical protein